MNELVAIDPGSKTVAWAHFQDRELRACGAARGDAPEDLVDDFEAQIDSIKGHHIRLAIERPVIYPVRKMKGDANDLITIALTGALCAGKLEFREVEFLKPQEWKGQVPKNIHHKRVMYELLIQELGVLQRCNVIPSLRHNVIDAVGVGLYALGRKLKP